MPSSLRRFLTAAWAAVRAPFCPWSSRRGQASAASPAAADDEPGETGPAAVANTAPSELRPFVIEALVSAGPRHSSLAAYREDRTSAELGEDCAGYASMGGRSIFWLCDGTADGLALPRLEFGSDAQDSATFGFSARILAQDIGQGFVAQMAKALREGTDPTGVDLAVTTFQAVADEWQDRLRIYLARLREIGRLDQLLHALPEAADGSLRVKWSTTFLGGVFDERRGRLAMINCGDSGAAIMTAPPAVVTPNKRRVVLGAVVHAGDAPQVTVTAYAQADSAWEVFEGIEGFVMVSDGLARRDLRGLLQALAADFGPRPLAEVRRELLRRADLTEDDKAVLVGRFLRV